MPTIFSLDWSKLYQPRLRLIVRIKDRRDGSVQNLRLSLDSPVAASKKGFLGVLIDPAFVIVDYRLPSESVLHEGDRYGSVWPNETIRHGPFVISIHPDVSAFRVV